MNGPDVDWLSTGSIDQNRNSATYPTNTLAAKGYTIFMLRRKGDSRTAIDAVGKRDGRNVLDLFIGGWSKHLTKFVEFA